MKTNFLKISKSNFQHKLQWMRDNAKLIIIFLVTLLLLLISCKATHGQANLAMALVAGVAGGKHVVDGPVTTEVAREASPHLLLNEIDKQVVKIRPMATPIDQISRMAGAKHAASMTVNYYNVDTKPTTATLTQAYTEPAEGSTSSASGKIKLRTSNNLIFDYSDTILVQGVYGYDEQGINPTKQYLVLYVTGREADDSAIWVQPVNGKSIGGTTGCCPSIPKGTTLIRMGRAASELDVMSPQFEAMPTKDENYCQIFKMQVEQSTLEKLQDKEVAWNLSDQQEAAIYDMRLGMEKNFLFGIKKQIYDNTKKEQINLTGGIWFQAGKTFNYEDASFNQDVVVDLMREAFTGNAGSKRKILIGGSGLIGRLNKLDYTKVITASDTTTRWGIDFTELRSKFGSLYVLLSEVFDEVGMSDNGLVVDPQYLQKYVHIPFDAEKLDLKKSGMRNVDAVVLTEASCLVLRYPKAHMRVVMQ